MPAATFSVGTKATRQVVRPCRPRARAVAAAARAAPQRSRRAFVAGGAAAAAAAVLLAPRDAQAFLGFGEDAGKVYTDATAALLKQTNDVLAMDGDKEDAVKALKKDMNSWTARYRTDGKVGGRPSFSNMYSAVNALAGHWNSFGADAPIPKKRLARIQKELDDVDRLLARGR